MKTVWKHKRDATFFPLSAWERVNLSKLCAIARRLDSRLAIPATSSNFSFRAQPEAFLMTRSGLHKRLITPEHFLRVDVTSGLPLHPLAPKPSDETLLHAMLYSAFPSARAIVHCHAPELEKCRVPAFHFEGHELLKALGARTHLEPFSLSVFPNDQNMQALVELISPRLKEPSLAVGFVLEKHGVYCVGTDVEQAHLRLEAILHLLTAQGESIPAIETGSKKEQPAALRK
jgi:ribulose-5-phosphate 4-epimerase/fuculose-1-phosphate aldolase